MLPAQKSKSIIEITQYYIYIQPETIIDNNMSYFSMLILQKEVSSSAISLYSTNVEKSRVYKIKYFFYRI
jgi:hypothetical protein